MPTLRTLVPLLAAALLAASCHDSDGNSGSSTPLVVTSVAPIVFPAFQTTPFTITGSGFDRSATGNDRASISTGVAGVGQAVAVTFRAREGTPFANGTAAEAEVEGIVVSDTEITGTAPVTSSSGGWVCTVEVRDAFGSATTPTPATLYTGLTVLDIDQEVIRADEATPFEVFGLTFLPASGNATVRFTSTTPGAFPGGSDTLDVPGTITNVLRINGTTPVFALAAPIQAFVSVVLDDEPTAPVAISKCALVEFQPPPPVPVVVTSIAPPSMPLATSMLFTITGSGFLGATDPEVEITFTAASGTPLVNGSAVAVTVPGNATSDTTVIGLNPTGTAPNDITAFVTVTRVDGIEGTSATDIVTFTVPSETVAGFSPYVLRADTSTAFTINGTNLPTSQTATVRFRSVEGTPFNGGTTDTIDVTANVTSATQIDGLSPLGDAQNAFLAEVTVILQGGLTLPMGVRCVFLAPAPGPTPPSRMVTNGNDSGPGSLRDTLANAVPGCLITFDGALAGTSINVTSTLSVTVPVTVLGLGANDLQVGGFSGFPDFPIFTIEAAAAGTEIQRLKITGSRHNNDGGGVRVRGDLTLTQCVVDGNQIAGRGAALCITDNADVSLVECTLSNNTTTNRGGTFVQNGCSLSAVRCTFSGNSSNDGGGGVALDNNSTFSANNCTFQGNGANGGSGGGALLITSGSTATVLHCTFADNFCNSRGGGVVVQGTMVATNCIFSRNSAGQEFPEIWNQGTNNTTFSLVRVDSGSGLTNGTNGNIVGTSSAPRDAQLEALTANGGPTKTMALQPTSPARNVANVAAALERDQRSEPRPQGAGPDMGAYEAN